MKAKHTIHHTGGTTYRLFLADALDVVGIHCRQVDLVIGSPPYPEKGKRYGDGWPPLKSKEWAEWMARVTMRCLEVCRGPVGWVVNNSARGGRYRPAVERLLVALDDAGVCLERPCIWHKNAPPSRKDWFGNDWESIVWAKHSGSVPHFNWEAIGTPPKYMSGGRFRQRGPDGKRRAGGEYPKSKVTRPRDVFRVTVGGGHLGSPLAHENEAPFPESLVDPFIRCLCPPGGTVLDPFCGSGTTLAAAAKVGRNAIGCDIRESQIELTRRRLQEGDDGE